MLMGKQDGKGTHKSLGRINKQTGETVLPPWNKRTKEQKRQSTHGKHVRKAHTWHEHDGHGCFTENNGRTRDILGE